jgi:hypothetical protein
MKKIADLITNNETSYEKSITAVAVEILEEHKLKPHPYGKCMVRVSIGGRYYCVSAITHKWALVPRSGAKKWKNANDISDFVRQAKSLNDWIKEQNSKTPKKATTKINVDEVLDMRHIAFNNKYF